MPGNWPVAVVVAAAVLLLFVDLILLAVLVKGRPRAAGVRDERDARDASPHASFDRQVRPRTVFVASGEAYRDGVPGRRSLAEALPPDLAELVTSAAPVVPHSEDVLARALLDRSEQLPTIVARPGHDLTGYDDVPPPVSNTFDTDLLTRLEGPAGWSRLMAVENARLLRYRRPVTIVVAEVEGLRRLAERLGPEPVERLMPVIAQAFRREARRSDWVARLGEARFAALLPETDESQAVNYAERVRLVCEPWLSSAAVPMRLAIGWSGPTASGDLEFAVARAEERMHSDRRVPAKALTSRSAPPRGVALPVVDGAGGPTAVAREPGLEDGDGATPQEAAFMRGGADAVGTDPGAEQRGRRRSKSGPEASAT